MKKRFVGAALTMFASALGLSGIRQRLEDWLEDGFGYERADAITQLSE